MRKIRSQWRWTDYVRRCLLVAVIEDELAGFAVGKAVAGLSTGSWRVWSVDLEAARGLGVGCGSLLCKGVVDWCGVTAVRMVVELEVRVGSHGCQDPAV